MMSSKILPQNVREYILFSKKSKSLCKIQERGVAGLYNFIQSNGRFAYLADEVGMGKTYQALGMLATVFQEKPDARVVIVCPKSQLQLQWISDYQGFVTNSYLCSDTGPYSSAELKGDNVLKDIWQGRSVKSPVYYNRLSDFARDILLDRGSIHLLRYSSFMHPVYFDPKKKELCQLWDVYTEAIKFIGVIADPQDNINSELKLMENDKTFQPMDEEEKRTWLKRRLKEKYAGWINELLGDRKIDLLICDEAQYLRYPDNLTNTIFHTVFKGNVEKYLFLSATPLHSSNQDIKVIDHYVTPPLEPAYQIKRYLDEKDKLKGQKLVDCMKSFMIRRIRRYQTSQNLEYTKSEYRDYTKNEIQGNKSPVFALTMAMVQKNLVKQLDGGNNTFRLGECSSFESLQSSFDAKEMEDQEGSKEGDDNKTIDRRFINKLIDSFKTRFIKESKIDSQLPHVKIFKTVEKLGRECIENGSGTKALVFVRRLDTVDELMNRLMYNFQTNIDKRIQAWEKLINIENKNYNNFSAENYWDKIPRDDAEILDPDDDGTVSTITGKIENLSYIKAVRNGFLKNYRNRFNNASDPKSRFFEVSEKGGNPEDSLYKDWDGFLNIFLDNEDKKTYQAFVRNQSDSKVLLIKRCIMQSIRMTDVIVDLNILDRFYEKGDRRLSDLFLSCLRGELCKKNMELSLYFEHLKAKIRKWFIYMDVISSQCFRNDKNKTWKDMAEHVNKQFREIMPVAGRSGRITGGLTVNQFKFPIYPNILICTDVLKEGINLHLFCDQCYHYGVAYTSGDLEQRIGRVDRFQSMIERKISRSDGTTNVPQLKVLFPYLSGTLDSRQVSYVLQRKKVNDQIMDFGNTDEEKEVSPECDKSIVKQPLQKSYNIYEPDFSHIESRSIISKSRIDKLKQESQKISSISAVIYATINSVLEDHQEDKSCEDGVAWNPNSVGKDNDLYKLQYIASFNVFVLKRIWIGNKQYLKDVKILSTTGRSHNQVKYEKALLLNLDYNENNQKQVISDFIKDRHPEPNPIFESLEKFLKQLRILQKNKTIWKYPQTIKCYFKHSTKLDKQRSQEVLIEHKNSSLILRSFVADRIFCNVTNLNTVIMDANASLTLGHLHQDRNDRIWYCLPVQYYAVLNHQELLEKLLKYAGITADRYQQLLTGMDDDEMESPYLKGRLPAMLFPILNDGTLEHFNKLLSVFGPSDNRTQNRDEQVNFGAIIKSKDLILIDNVYNYRGGYE